MSINELDSKDKNNTISSLKFINSNIFFSKKWHPFVLLLSLIFSFILYGNTLLHDYAQDDAIVIYENEFTTQGVKGIPGLLKHDTFFGFFQEEGKSMLVSGGRYRPLTPIMFALEYQFFGKNPLVGHLLNILFFSFLGFIIYMATWRLLRDSQENHAYIIAMVTAFIFLLHPIHTEVVANIKGRDEIVSMLGSMMALLLAIKYIERKNIWLLILGSIIFFLALMSKENAITFLVVIPVSLYFFKTKRVAELLKVNSAFILAAIIFLVIRTQILGFDFGGEPSELMNNPFIKIVDGNYLPFDLSEKLATILFTLGKYLQLLFFPHPLTHDYYPRHIEMMTFADAEVWISILMYTVLILAVVILRAKHSIISFAIIFFLATLSIVSNLVFPIGTNMSERFLFMPSFGFCLIAALGFHQIFSRKSGVLAYVVLGIIALCFSYKTITRNMVWKDDLTLFTSDILISKNSAKLNNAVGGALTNESYKVENESRKQEMLEKAIVYLTKSISIHPRYKNPYLIRGNCYHLLGNFLEAQKSFAEALAIDPNYKDAITNSAINYRELGKDYGGNKGDLVNAIKYLEIAEGVRPNDYETLRLLGIAFGNASDHQKAISYFRRALDLSPQTATAMINLAKAYQNNGDISKAEEYFKLAIEMDPNALDE